MSCGDNTEPSLGFTEAAAPQVQACVGEATSPSTSSALVMPARARGPFIGPVTREKTFLLLSLSLSFYVYDMHL